MSNSIVTQRDTMLEKQRAGYIKLSLTNFTTSAEPTIAAGSVVEISGSLYSFTTNESITGWAAVGVGDAYIKLVPDGTNPCTAEFTATAPTWSDAKQGWYDATGTDRYVAGLYKTSSTEYDNKYIYDSVLRGNNTWTGDNTFLGMFKYSKYYKAESVASGDIFTAIDSWVPNVGDFLACFGQAYGFTAAAIVVGIYRNSTTNIHLITRLNDGSAGIFTTITSGISITYTSIEIMSPFTAIAS